MKKFFRNKKGQNAAEYAILIALVVGAIIAMQKFAQRRLQASIYDAGKYMVENTSDLGSTGQYEPYYAESRYTSDRNVDEQQYSNASLAEFTRNTDSTRSGQQTTTYDPSATVGGGMGIENPSANDD